MIFIPGINKEEDSGYTVYYIDEFTNELKSEIRDRLAAICHGTGAIGSNALIYSYKETAKEFVNRYKKDSDSRRKKGMIGELLAHIILEIEDRFTVASPFFNMEERSFKKGFDILLHDDTCDEIWIAEVKSGSIRVNQNNATEAALSLINNAKENLSKRLNSGDTSLWMNAINDAKIAMDNSNNQKDAVIELLEKCSDQTSQDIYSGNDQNVILIGVLFHPMDEHVIKEKIASKYNQVIEEELFKEVTVIVIQEETFEAVFNFIESESKA